MPAGMHPFLFSIYAAMQVHSFTVGPFVENTYLLTSEGRAVLIDPGFTDENEFKGVKTVLRSHKITLDAIILTHAHVDHVLGIPLVLNSFDVPVYLCDKDYYLWENFASQAKMFGFSVQGFDFVPEILPLKKKWEI